MIIQVTQSEKNALYGGYGVDRPNASMQGPMKLYVGNLHFNIDEEMIRSIFEPFGRIEKIEMLKDSQGGRSRGYCFITYCTGENAKKAMEQLNGFELAGREIKVDSSLSAVVVQQLQNANCRLIMSLNMRARLLLTLGT